MQYFFNSYTSKYFFLPIYTLINLFIVINNEYTNYVNMLYSDNHENTYNIYNLNFVMLEQSDNIDQIKSNSQIFVNEYNISTDTD